MPLWVSLIAANYDMRRDAGKRFDGAPCCGRRCLLLFKAVGPVRSDFGDLKSKRKEVYYRLVWAHPKTAVFTAFFA
jgi:hypothetical protein